MKIFLLCGSCAIAVSACAPSYHTSVDTGSAYGGYGSSQAGYGYDQSAYGYDQSGYGYDQSAYGYETGYSNVTPYRSRYGTEAAAGLRGSSCDTNAAPCGFMRVVPVYPVYQYVTAPEVPVVETPQYVEPEPVVIYEPEPVYEVPAYEPPVYEPTVYSWPEADTPAPSWKPLRK